MVRQFGRWKFNETGYVWPEENGVKGHIRTSSEEALLAEIDRLTAEVQRLEGEMSREKAARFGLACHKHGADDPLPRYCATCGKPMAHKVGEGWTYAELLTKIAARDRVIASLDEDNATLAANANPFDAEGYAGLKATLSLIASRVAQAEDRWRQHTGREWVSPDMGDLLQWYMDQLDARDRVVEADREILVTLREAINSAPEDAFGEVPDTEIQGWYIRDELVHRITKRIAVLDALKEQA